MTCINLRERFGREYRVTYEESYWVERSRASVDDPWLMVLLCQNGDICPWGGTKLAACTRASGPVAQRLREHPAADVAQDGDDGVNAVFDVADFSAIAKIMKPRRRRRLSPEQKAAAVGRLQNYWPAKGEFGAKQIRQSAPAARARVSRGAPV